jgi:hypothetical protein
MPDPAAPAPPPAVRVSAAEREVRRHRSRRALGGWSAELIAEAEDPTAPQRIGRIVGRTLALRGGRSGRGACPPADRRARRTRQQGRRDKARAAAARGGRTAARRRAPRGLQFACNPLILLDRPQNVFPNVSKTKGFVGRRDPGRRRARGAGRRRAADPRGLQFACNPLICLDRARNPFPNVSTTKGFVGRGGAQPPTWVVQAREAGRGGRRARG